MQRFRSRAALKAISIAIALTIIASSIIKPAISNAQSFLTIQQASPALSARVLSSFPYEAQRSLPKGNRVDAHSQILDRENRPLIWNLLDHRWMAKDHGLQIDARESAPSAAEYSAFRRSIELVTAHTSQSPDITCPGGCTPRPSPTPIPHKVLATGGDSNVRWTEDLVGPPPDLYQGTDGNYYDSNGNEWGYVSGYGWAEYIGFVSNTTPPVSQEMQPYQTAYNFAYGLEPWFYGFATLPVFGMASFGSLGLNFGKNGSSLAMARYLAAVRAEIAATGVTVSSQTATSVNQALAAKGYTTPPFQP